MSFTEYVWLDCQQFHHALSPGGQVGAEIPMERTVDVLAEEYFPACCRLEDRHRSRGVARRVDHFEIALGESQGPSFTLDLFVYGTGGQMHSIPGCGRGPLVAAFQDPCIGLVHDHPASAVASDGCCGAHVVDVPVGQEQGVDFRRVVTRGCDVVFQRVPVWSKTAVQENEVSHVDQVAEAVSGLRQMSAPHHPDFLDHFFGSRCHPNARFVQSRFAPTLSALGSWPYSTRSVETLPKPVKAPAMRLAGHCSGR